jgi:ArsR family transcriptional regulator, virulence genes transcriptional regulator
MKQEKLLKIESIEEESLQVAAVLKQLGHPKKLLMMCHLTQGPVSVSEMEELIKMGQSQTSQYLRQLELLGWIHGQKEGKMTKYQIIDEKLIQLLEQLQKIFCS